MIYLLTPKIEPQNVKFFRATQGVYAAGFLVHLLLVVIFGWFGFKEMTLFNVLVSVPIFGAAFIFNRQGRHSLAFAFAFFEFFVHQVLVVYYLGWDSGAHYWFIYLAGLSFFNPFWSNKVQIVLLSFTLIGFVSSYSFNYYGVYQISKNNQLIIFAFNAITVVIVLSFLINNYSRTAQKAEENLNGVIGKLSEKNEEIAHQQENILQSISYAKIIQTAVIPDSQELATHFEEYFVLFEPVSIVSGDFYWFSATQEQVIVVCADCTGHGVPGGFMSMLGISFLGELVNNQHIIDPAEILNQLRIKVKDALRNNDQENQPKDGMDMSICVFDKQKKQVTFAGANNGMFLLRDGIIHEYKPTKNPIGLYPKEIPFDHTTIDLRSGDHIYLYTDGYIDQFGGPKNKKFMKKRLKETLLGLPPQSLESQGPELERIFKQWRIANEQIDDCTLIGLRV